MSHYNTIFSQILNFVPRHEFETLAKEHHRMLLSTRYSPELNPEERLNSDLKQAIGSKVPVRNKEKLRNAANDHMTMLEKNPERVASYFQDPLVKYAA